MAVAAVALGFSSCEEDTDPKYHAPSKYELNTPAMQQQYIELAPGATIRLTSSQPDYGYSAVAQYSAQMSLTEDFAQFEDLTPTNSSLAAFDVKQEDVATALCVLHGLDSEDAFNAAYPDGQMPFEKIYFRAVCKLDGVEGSEITSNVVSFDHIKGYFAIPVPGYIYLVGAPEGWAGPTEANAAHYADWRLFEPDNAIGSKVYSGVFDIEEGSAMFRFYTQLTGWDDDSYGSQESDNPIEFPDYTGEGSFTSPVVKGKGSFSFPNWPGGKATITVDMSDAKNITMTMTAGEQSVVVTKYIYLVGSLSGWMAPGTSNEEAYKPWRLADTTGDGIYSASFPVEAGHVNFRFALELTDADWDNDQQIGAAENDGDVACSLSNGLYTGSYVMGKGNYAFDLTAAGTLDIIVDTNNKQVTVNFRE